MFLWGNSTSKKHAREASVEYSPLFSLVKDFTFTLQILHCKVKVKSARICKFITFVLWFCVEEKFSNSKRKNSQNLLEKFQYLLSVCEMHSIATSVITEMFWIVSLSMCSWSSCLCCNGLFTLVLEIFLLIQAILFWLKAHRYFWNCQRSLWFLLDSSNEPRAPKLESLPNFSTWLARKVLRLR